MLLPTISAMRILTNNKTIDWSCGCASPCVDQGRNAGPASHVPQNAVSLRMLRCRFLLVATDSPILLVLRLSDWGVVRRLYGLDVDKFHNASIAWHRNSSYMFAGGWVGRNVIDCAADPLCMLRGRQGCCCVAVGSIAHCVMCACTNNGTFYESNLHSA